MNFCQIKKRDIANGPGVRVSLFVSGCTNHCEGCFQPETWDFNYGNKFTCNIKNEIYYELKVPFIDGITILGGEPFEPENQRELVSFLKYIKDNFPNKSIWCFTGFYYDKELLVDGSHPRCEVTDEMLSYIDILVDGRFDITKKNISLQFRGSENQRIIDLNKTREIGSIVLWNDKYTKSKEL